MLLYKTDHGAFLRHGDHVFPVPVASWDSLISRDDLSNFCEKLVASGQHGAAVTAELPEGLQPPIGSQEVWACGVTYYRSRDARLEETRESGGGDIYARVYAAERPEIFFKATPHRVVGHGRPVRIRRDARWNVPEPELALCIAPSGKILGYTIANDMSSRDIEAENPLYLPQAKIYDGCCALGPGILVREDPLPPSTPIRLEILRAGNRIVSGATTLDQMRREPRSLIECLMRESSFPVGCFLLTGTGIVPEPSFTLRGGDEIRITIDPIGTMVNQVA